MGVLRVVLALVVVGAGLGLGATSAAACSCVSPDTARLLADSEGAFIGTLVESDAPLPSVDRDVDDGVGYRFAVETWLSGPFDTDEIVVASPSSGDACGFNFDVGAYVAVFLYGTADGVPNSGLCSYVDGEAAKVALAPPTIDPAAGPATFAVIEAGSSQLWLMDAAGRVAGFTERGGEPGESQLITGASCAHSSLFLEAWAEGSTAVLVVRDLATLAVVDELPAPQEVMAVTCLDAAATDLRVAIWQPNGAAIWDPASGVRSDLTDVYGVVFVPSQTIALGYGPPGVLAVDLTTGDTATLYTAGAQPAGQTLPDTVEGIGVDPSGSSVAFHVTHYGPGMDHTTTVRVINLATGAERSGEIETEGLQLVWLSAGLLQLTGYDVFDTRALVLDANTLAPVEAPQLQIPWLHPLPDGDRVLTVDGHEVTAIDLATGERKPLAALPIEITAKLTPLSTPVTITADQSPRSDTEHVPPTDEPKPSPGPPATTPPGRASEQPNADAPAEERAAGEDQDPSTSGGASRTDAAGNPTVSKGAGGGGGHVWWWVLPAAAALAIMAAGAAVAFRRSRSS